MREPGVVFSRLVADLPLTGPRISSDYDLARVRQRGQFDGVKSREESCSAKVLNRARGKALSAPYRVTNCRISARDILYFNNSVAVDSPDTTSAHNTASV